MSAQPNTDAAFAAMPPNVQAALDALRNMVAPPVDDTEAMFRLGAATVFRIVAKTDPYWHRTIDAIDSIGEQAGLYDADHRQKLIDAGFEDANNTAAPAYEDDPIIRRWEANDPRNKRPANGHASEPVPERDANGTITAKDNHGASLPIPEPTPVLLSKAQFLADYTPPDWLWDGILQRRFVYSLTAKTGDGKTAFAELLSEKVAACDRRDATIGGHPVDEGNVIYFAGENPDDLRNRMIASDHISGRDCSQDRISIIPGTFGIDAMRAECEAKAKTLPGGKIDLVIVDTSAAYFLGDDENNNPQMGGHARKLRTLTTLPGGPCVVVLCHPVKNANEQSALLPRGGGAFIAEMDGNLTLWRTDDVTELWHTGKLRGPGFEPISFRLERVTCEALVDTKGRMSPTVRAVAITDSDKEAEARTVRSAEDTMLVAILEQARPIAGLAAACGWVSSSGEPQKSKAHRILKGLEKSGLVRLHRGAYELTERGDKAAKAAVRTSAAQ